MASVDAHRRRAHTHDARMPTGTPLRERGIGNSMFDRHRCFMNSEPFDPSLGLSGGEDTLFMRQLTRGGRRLIRCSEALVWETVPAERLEAGYLLRRLFRAGQTTTLVCIALRPRQMGRALRHMAGGAVQATMFGPGGSALWLLRRPSWLPFMIKAAGGCGKLFWHRKLHLQMYRTRRAADVRRNHVEEP